MAISSVSDFSFINQQIKVHQQIEVYLGGLEALMTITVMANNFYDLPKSILHNYFSIACDLLDKVAKENQLRLNELLKQER